MDSHLKLKLALMIAVLITVLIVLTSYPISAGGNALATGYTGRAFERSADDSIGSTIQGVELTFVKEDGSSTFNTVTYQTLNHSGGIYGCYIASFLLGLSQSR